MSHKPNIDIQAMDTAMDTAYKKQEVWWIYWYAEKTHK